ncbi:MAG: ROK family protein [Candidatus Gastranaerophilales bacterium]|nr:ROK family protein [Candidatus Gastranaerophilales bacterium]
MKNDNVAIGIDIGGTKISAAVVSNGQVISEVLTYKTPDNSKDILNTILEEIESLKDQYKPKYVGIATAGTVDIDNSKVTGSTGNLPEGYNKLEFKKVIEEKLGLKTLIENDANAAAYAEFKIGSGRGHNNTIVITLGTGIGTGIIVDGKLFRGKSGAGAECGHLVINIEKKRRCTCGAWNCWEAFASGTGFAKNAKEMANEIPINERTGILKDKNPDEITTYDIIEGIKKDDPFAVKAYEYWQNLVLIGLISLANVFDPDSIILSGGMAKFINYEKLQKELEKETVVSNVKLFPAKTENYAGLIGAAFLAVEKFSG